MRTSKVSNYVSGASDLIRVGYSPFIPATPCDLILNPVIELVPFLVAPEGAWE